MKATLNSKTVEKPILAMILKNPSTRTRRFFSEAYGSKLGGHGAFLRPGYPSLDVVNR